MQTVLDVRDGLAGLIWPDAAQTVEMDLQLLVAAARIAERYSRPMREARVAEFALEFAHIMRNELNYYIEAHRTDRLREALADYEVARLEGVLPCP